MHEFVPQRTSAYIGQYDVHIPQMTVRETLTFSAKCQGAGTVFRKLEDEFVQHELAIRNLSVTLIVLFICRRFCRASEERKVVEH